MSFWPQFLRDAFAGLRDGSPHRRIDPSCPTCTYAYLADLPDHIAVAQRMPAHGWSLNFYQAIPEKNGYQVLADSDQDKIWEKVGYRGADRTGLATDILLMFFEKQMSDNPAQIKDSIGNWRHFSDARETLQHASTLAPPVVLSL
ncbi:MAG: hypothetical protein V4621_07320 [Pseudomonadota bacterium]